MTDIEQRAREMLIEACRYCGVEAPPGYLLAPFAEDSGPWMVAQRIARLAAAVPPIADIEQRARNRKILVSKLGDIARRYQNPLWFEKCSCLIEKYEQDYLAALQSPDPKAGEAEAAKLIFAVSEALGLFPSVIKCGEHWSPTCERVLVNAREALIALGALAIRAAAQPSKDEP